MELIKKKCTPCSRGGTPLKGDLLDSLFKQLAPGWNLVEERFLEKEYVFSNFKKALVFTNQVGEIAEAEGHHPDLFLSYGKVKIRLWTHKMGALSENDFIVAAKIDALPINN